MFKKAQLIFGTIAVVVFCPLSSHADVSVDVGPFNIDLGDGGGFYNDGIGYIEDTVCRAINRQLLLEVIKDEGENEEKDQKQKTAKLKRLIIEPYLLGYNKDGALIIRGFQITEFSIPEEFSKRDHEKNTGGVGFLGGLLVEFKGSDKLIDLKMPNIRKIRVVRNSHFKVRNKDELGKSEDISRPLCSLIQR